MNVLGPSRRILLAGFAASLLGVAAPNATRAQGWLAAADPFEKFAKDIIDFAKYLIDRSDAAERKRIAEAAPSLVKLMHDTAANKRALAAAIENALNGKSSDLVGLANSLDKSVKALVEAIKNLDPAWAAEHDSLTKNVSAMKFEKIDASQQVLEFVRIQGGRDHDSKIDKDDAITLVNKLNELAAKLDSEATDISKAFIKP